MAESKAAAVQEDGSCSKADLEKRIQALRKKIRLSESLWASSSNTSKLTAKQVKKLSRLDILRKELEDLDSKLSIAIHREFLFAFLKSVATKESNGIKDKGLLHAKHYTPFLQT